MPTDRPRHKDDLIENPADRMRFAKGSFDKISTKTIDEVREGIRSAVTISLMLVYGGAVLVLIIAGSYILIKCKDHPDISGILNLGDMLLKLVLPVVTLVLGFYYGTQDKK